MRYALSGAKVMQLAGLCILLMLVGACATGSAREGMLTLPTIEGASHVGDEECARCHAEVQKAFAMTVHGKLAEFETGGCETCHGPGSLHVGEGDTENTFNFAALNADQASAICLKCHSARSLTQWRGNMHAMADVACSDCHRIHQGGEPVYKSLKQAEPALCYSCHQDYQSKANSPSHHPIKEGKMVCTSCHEPHGTAAKGLLKTDGRPNALCLDCHARHQGPFVFRHAPVQEDCNICHDPHGSVAENLLKQSEPFLCLQCHESHFNATRTGPSSWPGNATLDGTALNGAIPAAGSPTTADTREGFASAHGTDAWAEAFGTSCTVCHSTVHGSDLPSMSAPSINSDGTRGWTHTARVLTRYP